MQPFTIVSGPAAPLMQANIDTDVIIPIERLTGGDLSGIGRYALEPLRYLPGGADNPDFVLNQPAYRGAPILVAGPNFGCGSSREPAVTALMALGLRCVIASSFGDIFYANCFHNGLLPVRLTGEVVSSLAEEAGTAARFQVDLPRQIVTAPSGREHHFEVDAFRRTMLLEGLDSLGATLKDADLIAAWQARDRGARPWIWMANREGAR